MDEQNANDKILHEDSVRDVVDDEIADSSTHAAIADLASPSASYVQAEAVAQRNATNAILAVLRDIGAIPAT